VDCAIPQRFGKTASRDLIQISSASGVGEMLEIHEFATPDSGCVASLNLFPGFVGDLSAHDFTQLY
jgi:hypothetical protein